MNGTEVQTESSLKALIDAFAGGFQSSTEETILFIVVIALIVGAFVVIAIVQSRTFSKRSKAHSAETFDILARKHQLSRSQRQCAEMLANCHRDPKQKHEVLVNHRVFNECVGLARERGEEIPEVALSSLRLKLGFVEIGPEVVPQSSEEIPRDASILLVPPRGKGLKVRVADQTPEGIIVNSTGEPLRLSPGTLLSARFANRSGLYTFETHVHDIMGTSITIDHSDDIRRIQRRRFYRKKTGLHAEVKSMDFETKFFDSMIIDLSGAGAAVTDNDDILRSGDEIGLAFELGGEDFRVPGRVLYISGPNRIAHIAFEKLAPSVQDRVIRNMLKSG